MASRWHQIAWVAGLCLLPFSAWASDDPEMTSRQQELNDDAVDALDAGDYESAVGLLSASLQLGELNVTHANLGRAYQNMGYCGEADTHFKAALEAPAVERPTPEQVEAAIDSYRGELVQSCPGFLEVECSPEGIALFVDDEGPQECDEDALELMAGVYTIRGEYDDRVTETTVAVEALETSRMRLGLSSAEVKAPEDEEFSEVETMEAPPSPSPAEVSASSSTTGWLLLGAAGAAVAGGVVLDTVPEQSSNYEFNAINLAPVGLYGAGLGLTFMGIRSLRR